MRIEGKENFAVKYTVRSPWGEVDSSGRKGLSPRVDTLDGKTVGLFAHFKEHAPLMLAEIGRMLKREFPGAEFLPIQYTADTKEIKNDPEFRPFFLEWLDRVDAVIGAYGDAGSCAMFLAYNTAYIENLGKPAVMLCNKDVMSAAYRGAAARLVPSLRLVECPLPDFSLAPALDEEWMERDVRPGLAETTAKLADALTRPLAEFETRLPKQEKHYANLTYTGDYREVNDYFYKMGWSNGTPIAPPTEEAVEEMLTGTDLSADCVVAEIPPMLGKATVEKIAINAVMTGCLPTYMPVLIAAVRGMTDPRIHLEGWTCSAAGWMPVATISGPIRTALNMTTESPFMSPYKKANAAIAKAISSIIMNIGGTRPGIEDVSQMGHEARFGVCLAENEEDSPWRPLQTDYGFGAEESAITLFWPQERHTVMGKGAAGFLRNMCEKRMTLGWDFGCQFIISPVSAATLAAAGYNKKDVIDYIVEYARRPSDDIHSRWLRGNHHVPAHAVLPDGPGYSVRHYWSDEHVFLIVGGNNYGSMGVALLGGGDHGGPSCTKIELPGHWDALVERYKPVKPEYIRY
jgi:hypothetical protein